MRLVNIESPFAGNELYTQSDHIRYARECMKDCLDRGEAPIASHLLYTQVLDDDVPELRELGIEAGFAWNEHAEATVVYADYGVSQGMLLGIKAAIEAGRDVEIRRLYDA